MVGGDAGGGGAGPPTYRPEHLQPGRFGAASAIGFLDRPPGREALCRALVLRVGKRQWRSRTGTCNPIDVQRRVVGAAQGRARNTRGPRTTNCSSSCTSRLATRGGQGGAGQAHCSSEGSGSPRPRARALARMLLSRFADACAKTTHAAEPQPAAVLALETRRPGVKAARCRISAALRAHMRIVGRAMRACAHARGACLVGLEDEARGGAWVHEERGQRRRTGYTRSEAGTQCARGADRETGCTARVQRSRIHQLRR